MRIQHRTNTTVITPGRDGGEIRVLPLTATECGNLADMLEGLNTPDSGDDPPLRRLTDLLWSLQDDVGVGVIVSDDLEAP